jgi:hypothetical protein
MKFVRTLKVFILAIFYILNHISSKKHMNKKHKAHQDSQGTRNYRKVHTNPSFNPLPNNWDTAPRHNFSNLGGRKYHDHVSKLTNSHSYQDSTRVMSERARHLSK